MGQAGPENGFHFNSLSTAGKAEISGNVPDQRLKVDTEFDLATVLESAGGN